ncbi:MAG TPA: RDD family protein [Candidatus Acidoferrales bacterium]|nr:RDD family protein [Candidatus Acidoferrales bacterium]
MLSMDRDIDVRTPESIEFTYALAGLGSRFLAWFVDFLIQICVILAIFFGIVLVASKLPSTSGAVSDGASKVGAAILIAMVVVVLFTILFGYFIAFEAFWNGQTPGKKMLGIRVVRDGGYPIDFGASMIRNLIRVAEMLFGMYALSAASATLSPENKRLGDIAAGTIVVRDARLAVPSLDALKGRTEPVYGATAFLSGDERALVRRFLDRRDELNAAKRAELAAQLAGRVRPRVPPELQRLPDEALLERL